MLKLLAGATVLVAVLSTALWLTREPLVEPLSRTGAVSFLLLLVTTCATSVNLFLRWFRWHFMLRRFGVLLRTRSSLLVYLATLPAILTPFYLGELLRSLVFLRQKPALKYQSLQIWLVERGTDASVLLLVCAWKLFGGWVSLAAGGLILGALVSLVSSIERRAAGAAPKLGSAALLAGILFSATLMSWLLPMAALWSILQVFSANVGFLDSAYSFGAATLLGGLSASPGGVAVTGSAGILLLEQVSTSDFLPWSMAILRLGTVWFSVALGAFVLWFRRKEVLASISTSGSVAAHFNELSAEYEGELSGHTRDKLIRRKVHFMQTRLQSLSPESLTGLDIGCGQGWYAAAMAHHGHHLVGVDTSEGQVEQARLYTARQGVWVECTVADATRLPFPDAFFDFAYSINVLHHVLDDRARELCYAEIVRVLKPGGKFFLHEMNVLNPLFRMYMSYVFPLVKRIDEGDERWVLPNRLPPISGARWEPNVAHFTFLPDFLPQILARWLTPLEGWLERSERAQRYSAHYMATLAKHGGETGA